MHRFSVLCLGFALAAFVVVGGFLAFRPADDLYSSQRASLSFRLEQEQLERQAARSNVLEPVIRVSLAVLILAPAAVVVLAVFVGVDAYRLRRRVVWADYAGRLPVARRVVEQDAQPALASVAAYHMTELERARSSGRPAVIAAPHPTAALPVPDGALPSAPSFAQLLADGFYASRDRVLLGYSADGPVYGGVDALLSTGVAGRPNQGKSTLLRFIYAQVLMLGGMPVVFDLHGTMVQDVPGAVVADTVSSVEQLCVKLHQLMDKRQATRRGGRPVLVFLDDWPSLSLASPAAVDLVRRIVLDARKWNVYALIAGQGLPADKFGGSLVRDALSSRFIFQTSEDQARIAGLERKSRPLVTALRPGLAVLDGPVPAQVVAIPSVTVADVLSLVRGRVKPSAEVVEVAEVAMEAHGEAPEVVEVESTSPADFALRQRMEVLHSEGLSKSAIIKEVFGATGGRAYQRASAEYDQLVAMRS